MQTTARTLAAATGLVMGLALAGCSSTSDAAEQPSESATTPATATSSSDPNVTEDDGAGPVPTVTVQKTLATGLDVPWGVAFLADGSALVAERPTGRVVRVGADGGTTPVGTIAGVNDRGEGGLLGLAVLPAEAKTEGSSSADADGEVTVYAYYTSTSDDNRVVRMTYDGTRLSKATPVLTGIPAAGNHNGGLVTIGPDDKLWIGTGEGGQPPRSQDRENLGGKILRLDLDGSIPDDNPFPGSPVYSLGHRNVQGLAFDSDDRPWAVEFGQNTWDELNLIEAGGNYGWPEVEGKQAEEGFIEPLVQWSTDEASPSGMAIVDDVAYIGGLRGERLWQVPLTGTTTGPAKAYLEGEFGRIRNVVAAPGGRLWITTSNRDGRGNPGDGDDKIVRLDLPTD